VAWRQAAYGAGAKKAAVVRQERAVTTPPPRFRHGFWIPCHQTSPRHAARPVSPPLSVTLAPRLEPRHVVIAAAQSSYQHAAARCSLTATNIQPLARLPLPVVYAIKTVTLLPIIDIDRQIG